MSVKRAFAAACAAEFGVFSLSPGPHAPWTLICICVLGALVFLAAWNGELK
jgi:hypothetical protein